LFKKLKRRSNEEMAKELEVFLEEKRNIFFKKKRLGAKTMVKEIPYKWIQFIWP